MSSDVFVMMLKTNPESNSNYNAVNATDRFKWQLMQTEGVQNVVSYVDVLKRLNSAFNEGNLKRMALPRSKAALDSMTMRIIDQLASTKGTLSPIIIFLNDHIGLIMAVGVSTWVFSPIKFQADMGILLTFMFLFNMWGAMTLIRRDEIQIL